MKILPERHVKPWCESEVSHLDSIRLIYVECTHGTIRTFSSVFFFLLYRRRYFYLFLNWFSTPVNDDRKYVCRHRLYACITTQKFKGLDCREITSLPEIKKWFTWHIISIIVENKPHPHHGSICIQWKFTTPDHRSFANQDSYVFFRPLSSVHLLQRNQRFQAIEFMDRRVSEKL